MEHGTPRVSPAQIGEDLWAALATQALVSGIELRVFTHIAGGKSTPGAIARAAHTSERGTRMLLDALAALGYLSKNGETYALEPVANTFLVQGKASYMGDLASATRLTYAGWANLTEAVKSGKPANAVDVESSGKEFFPKLVGALFPSNYSASRAALGSIPAKKRAALRDILDVAAGSGAWSIPFAEANEDARVTVVDFPEVTPIAREFAARFGVQDRYTYLEGSIRNLDFGRKKYDLVILGHIIHSEGLKWGKKLIKKSFNSLRDGGLLLIGEMIPNDDRTGPKMAVLFGLNMLLHTNEGDVFTMKEYRRLLREAGFKKTGTISAPSPSPLILATK
ncbi:MAG TPA: methyltransferase [Blastocatellia bacterium]|nr:methyltransferase [Blastocatellia bacterium]